MYGSVTQLLCIDSSKSYVPCGFVPNERQNLLIRQIREATDQMLFFGLFLYIYCLHIISVYWLSWKYLIQHVCSFTCFTMYIQPDLCNMKCSGPGKLFFILREIHVMRTEYTVKGPEVYFILSGSDFIL